MTRPAIAFALLAALSLAPRLALADDTAPSQTSTQAAPADAKAGGCMPDGGCCGNGACRQAAGKAADETGRAPGCPCGRQKSAAEPAGQ
jgi:hypothetical protein